MFSEASFILSTGGSASRVVSAYRDVWLHVGLPNSQPPYWHLVVATVAVGMHPTGMHSCSWPIFYRPQTKFGKVMFSQVSVCPHKGCAWWWGHVWQEVCMEGMYGWGGHVWRECVWQCGCAWWRGAWVAGVVWQGACMAGEMATAAGGKHPTGIYSCYKTIDIPLRPRQSVTAPCRKSTHSSVAGPGFPTHGIGTGIAL